MALTKISRGLLSTGVSDSSDATAITIDSSEIVSFSSHIKLIDNGFIVLGAGEDLKLNSDGTNGIINAAQGYLALQTGSTERMRIASNGNVGIGDTVCDQLFTVKGGSELQATNSTNGWITYTYTDNTLRLNYNGSGSDEITINSDGKVGIGTTSPTGILDVHSSSTAAITVEQTSNAAFNHVGEFFAPNTAANNNALFAVGKSGTTKNTGYLGYHWVSDASNDNFAHISQWGADYLFRVYGQGNYYFAGSSVSDRDLKENIVDIPEPSLDKVKQLRVRKFNMKSLGENDVTPTKVGFIAQEVKEAMPNVVTGTDGQKDMAVDTTGIVGHLVKAIQEQQTQIEALQAEINTLKGE